MEERKIYCRNDGLRWKWKFRNVEAYLTILAQILSENLYFIPFKIRCHFNSSFDRSCRRHFYFPYCCTCLIQYLLPASVTFLISRTLYWKEMYLNPQTTTFTIFSPSLLFKILFLIFSLFQSSCFSFSYFPSIWLSNLPFPTFSFCPLFSCSSPSVLFFFFMYVCCPSVRLRQTYFCRWSSWAQRISNDWKTLF